MSEDRPQEQPYEVHPALARFISVIEDIANYISRHWAGMINLMLLLYVGLPLLAPVFMQVGWTFPARVVYTVYAPACHQLPERSYFLFGESAVYGLDTFHADGVELSDNLLLRRRYIGDDEHGWKVAICQRDIAIYGSMFLAGLIFALARFRFPQLSWKLYLLFLVPMALDGGAQLIGVHSSSWQLRTITGVLFGVATIWLIYPYLADSMNTASVKGKEQGVKIKD